MNTFADIFCGGGLASYGLLQAGLTPLWAVDSDTWACQSYEANIGHAPLCQRVESVDWAKLPSPWLLWGSPPCQGYSTAGKRQKDDARNNLVWSFVWAVAALRPATFVMENVPGIGQGDLAHYPSIIRMALETMGYNVTVMKLNAADYGTPQIRRRVFWVGALDFVPQIPVQTHTRMPWAGLKPWVTVREALGIPYDAPSLVVTATEGKGSIYPEKRARASDCLLSISHDGERSLDHPAYTPVASGNALGGLYIRRVHSENSQANGPVADVSERPAPPLPGEPVFLNDDMPSRPTGANGGQGFVAGQHSREANPQYRRLTVDECKVLMGLPVTYRLYGPQSAQYQQAGNGVCPAVSQAIARSLVASQAATEREA